MNKSLATNELLRKQYGHYWIFSNSAEVIERCESSDYLILYSTHSGDVYNKEFIYEYLTKEEVMKLLETDPRIVIISLDPIIKDS